MEESPKRLSEKYIEEEEKGNNQLSRQLHLNRIEDSDPRASHQNRQRNESTESMECRNGSVQSTDSSRSDWEERHQDGTNPEFECSSEDDRNISPVNRGNSLLPNKQADAEDIYLSPTTHMRSMLNIDDLLNNDSPKTHMGSKVSSENGSDTKLDHEDQFNTLYETISESATSSHSNQSDISCSSFRFPVLEWQWIGSPITWPRSDYQIQSDNTCHQIKSDNPHLIETKEKLQLTKHKPRRPSLRSNLRCCKF